MPIEVGEDAVIIPNTETVVDENGNTTVIGYPSSGSTGRVEGSSEPPYTPVIGGGLGGV